MEQAKKSSVVVLGPTGTGKSALCNTLCGDISKTRYAERSEIISEISKTKQETVKWFGNESEFILVDTPGLGDSEHRDTLNLADIVKTLKQLESVNAFILVFNGQNPRMDGQLRSMMMLFKEMFGEKFLENILLVFTRWPMDQRSRTIRAKLGENEEFKSQAYNQKIQQLFNLDTNIAPIPCFFTDNCYIEPDMDIMTVEELERFHAELKNIKNVVEAMTPFECKDIKIAHTERDENQKKFEHLAMKEIHESLKDNSREEYTLGFTKELRTKFPNRNCLIIDNKWNHTVNVNNYSHEHFEKPAMWGTYGYDVYVFDDGFVRKDGDGGDVNWDFQGCFTKLDSFTLAFQINTAS
jgi:predicted GTPase